MLFRERDLAHAVAEVQDLERLDEERLPARGLVVHHAADLGTRLRAYRDDVPPVALRDDRLLQEWRELGRAEDLV